MDAINELYAESVVSVEAMSGGGMPRQMEGKPAVIGKATWWEENNEVHHAAVQGPYPHGEDKFAVHFDYEITPKGGQRMRMDEIAVYTVQDGRIVREEFYFDMG